MKTKNNILITVGLWFQTISTGALLAADAMPLAHRELPPEWGIIGVRATGMQPYVCFGREHSARLVARAAGERLDKGAQAAGELLLSSDSSEATLFWMFATPPFIVLYTLPQLPGAIIGGANQGVSKKAAREADAAFPPALNEFGLREGLPAWFCAAVPEPAAGHMIILPPEGVPHQLEEQVDTRIDLEVLGLGVKQISPSRASRELVVSIYMKIVRVRDGKVLWSDAVEFRGGSAHAHTVAKWAANDGRLLRQEFARCRQDLPKLLVNRLFQAASATCTPLLASNPTAKVEVAAGK